MRSNLDYYDTHLAPQWSLWLSPLKSHLRTPHNNNSNNERKSTTDVLLRVTGSTTCSFHSPPLVSHGIWWCGVNLTWELDYLSNPEWVLMVTLYCPSTDTTATTITIDSHTGIQVASYTACLPIPVSNTSRDEIMMMKSATTCQLDTLTSNSPTPPIRAS